MDGCSSNSFIPQCYPTDTNPQESTPLGGLPPFKFRVTLCPKEYVAVWPLRFDGFLNIFVFGSPVVNDADPDDPLACTEMLLENEDASNAIDDSDYSDEDYTPSPIEIVDDALAPAPVADQLLTVPVTKKRLYRHAPDLNSLFPTNYRTGMRMNELAEIVHQKKEWMMSWYARNIRADETQPLTDLDRQRILGLVPQLLPHAVSMDSLITSIIEEMFFISKPTLYQFLSEVKVHLSPLNCYTN